MRAFFRMFGPAVIGSSGVQIAMFADTIIGSLLQTGGLSSIYYADRLYQLPIGLVGVAAGTVLLPEMSRCFAREDWEGAFTAQNRTLAMTIALTAPFVVAFMVIPDVIVRALFQHGAFHRQDALATAAVLRAYGAGLLAMVAINALRSRLSGDGRHADADAGVAGRAGDQPAAEAPALQAARRGGHRAGDLRQRLDQSRAAGVTRPAPLSVPARRQP